MATAEWAQTLNDPTLRYALQGAEMEHTAAEVAVQHAHHRLDTATEKLAVLKAETERRREVAAGSDIRI